MVKHQETILFRVFRHKSKQSPKTIRYLGIYIDVASSVTEWRRCWTRDGRLDALDALSVAVAVGRVVGLAADVGGVERESGRQLHVAEVAMPPRVLRRDALHRVVY